MKYFVALWAVVATLALVVAIYLALQLDTSRYLCEDFTPPCDPAEIDRQMNATPYPTIQPQQRFIGG